MFNFWKKAEPPVNVSYVIGKVTPLTKEERESLAMAMDFRNLVTKWCDAEIAKNIQPMLDLSIEDTNLRQSQGYVNGLLAVRTFMKTMK